MAKKKINKGRFPKPKVIGVIPMLEIDGDVWGLEVSILSTEEQNALKKANKEEEAHSSTG